MNEEEETTEQERYYLNKPWLTENPLPDILELKDANQHENGKFSCKGYYGNGMDEGLSEYYWPNVVIKMKKKRDFGRNMKKMET
jgi:hypothetical protein